MSSLFKSAVIPNEVGDALNKLKGFNIQSVNSVEELKNAIGYATDDFYKFAKSADLSGDVMQQYKKHINPLPSAIGKITTSLKALATSAAIMFALSAVIKVVSAAWDKFNTTVVEAEEDLKETQSTITSLKEQIKELESLDANSLTQGQRDKLENLKEQLEVQKQLEQIEKRRLARETIGNGNFADYFDEDSYKNNKSKLHNITEDANYNLNSVSGTFTSRQAYISSLNEQLANTKGLTEKQVEELENNLIEANRQQNISRETILGIQEKLITNKADIQSWMSKIQTYIDEGYVVGSDLTRANEIIKELQILLNGTNDEIERTNNLLYGGDDSIESVIAEKTKYTYQNLLDNGFTKDEIEILSTLTFDKDASLEELRKVLEEAQKIPVEPEVKFSKSQMIDTINSMSDGFDVLDDIYADIIDKGKFDFTKLDSKKFEESFSGLKDEYNEFIETVSTSPTDINACQDAFNKLSTAFIEQKGILNNLTEENKNVAISMLKNMGIANAEEIVMAQLNGVTGELILEKQFLAIYGYEVANASYAEVAGFLAEAEGSAVAEQYLAQLALEKIHVNEAQINTSADIENVLSLAEAAGASTVALAKLAKAKSILSAVEQTGSYSRAGISEKDYLEALKTAEQIEKGTFNYEYQKIDRSQFSVFDYSDYQPKYTGADQTASAIQKAADESAKDAKEAADDIIDFFERRIEVLENSFNLLGAGIENVLGAKAKNTLLAGQLEILDEETRNYTDAIGMYQEAAEGYLSLIPEQYRDAAKNGEVSLLQINDENVKEAIENYQQWANKVAECTQKLEELKVQIRELELEKFNNIIKDFTDQFDLHGTAIDNIDKQIGLLEEAGELIGSSYYTKQIEQSEKQLALLEQQKLTMVEQLNDSLSSGRIQQGTDEWLEMVKALEEVEGNILDCKTSIEEFNNALLEIQWIVFERIQTEFGNLNSEMENLAGLFNDFNDIEVSDGKGTWTKEAIATLGLYAQQYELARYQANQYGEAIEKLKEDYLAGKYSATEYMDKLAELSQGQWDAINSAESLEDAIIDLNETRVNEEIEAYKELIDAQIELIEETDKLKKKQDELAEKSKTVADIEKQLAAMMYDNSAATVAKRKLLEAELAEAQKDLSDTEYEYSKEAQIDALNKQFEDQETLLQDSLKDREALLNQSFNTVKENATLVGEQIVLIAQQHGVIASDAIITPWLNGENAIAGYGQTLSAQSSVFIGNIIGVENEVIGLQNQANVASVALANMFATRADNLVGQLQASYYAESNLNYATGLLQNSLINTLERGYDISGINGAINSIISGLSSVESTARRTAQAIQEAMNAQILSDSYRVLDNAYGRIIADGFSSKKEAQDWIDKHAPNTKKHYTVAKAFAKGSKYIDEDQLAWTDEHGKREMIIRPSDGAILTRLEKGDAVANAALTENLFKWGEINPGRFMQGLTSMTSPKLNVPMKSSQPSIVLDYDLNIGSFTDGEHLLGTIQKVSKESATKLLNDINRDFRIHGR